MDKEIQQNNSKNDSIKIENIGFRPLYIGLGLVLLAWLIFWLCVHFWGESFEKRGQLGDSFGMINSLFSAMAFAGIIYTIILQRNELSLQRDELVQTRKCKPTCQLAQKGIDN